MLPMRKSVNTIVLLKIREYYCSYEPNDLKQTIRNDRLISHSENKSESSKIDPGNKMEVWEPKK